jgi:hypothetical protein
MEIHSYGPVEVAIQKSITPGTPSQKHNYRFYWGVIVTLVAGGIIYWIISATKDKNKNSQTNQ